MKKQLIFVLLALVMTVVLSTGVFAASSSVDAEKADDISNAISLASAGDTVTVNLKNDIEVTSKIVIDKAVTVTINFNGNQLNYTGSTEYGYENTCFYMSSADATLNLNGSNPVSSAKDYTHYGDDVKPDMTGTSNLISILHGTLNVKNAYLLASENAWAIHEPLVNNNNALITIDNSVIRTPQGSERSAITSRGENANTTTLTKRVLIANNSVIYGGFYGDYSEDTGCNFNFTKGTSFTNIKFYDFAITNDCWYDTSNSNTAPQMMNSFEKSVLFDSCVFQNYDGTKGDVSVTTATGKQNIKLLNCDYNEITGTLNGDKGGAAYVFVVVTMPTCVKSGTAIRYGSGLSKSEVTVTAESYHSLGEAVITYPDGYSNKGVGIAACQNCGLENETGEVFDSLFETLGYSAYENGNSVTLGTKLNIEAYEKYKAQGNEALDFGVIAGNGNISVSVENGEIVVENGFAHSFDSDGTAFFDIKIVGIDDGKKEWKFAMEFYVFDGENIEYVEPELDLTSFDDIIYELDTVSRAVDALLETKHKLYYNDDGSFRVMTLSDVHMNTNGDAASVQEIKDRIKTLVDRENPDLIILTGDNVISAGNETKLRNDIDAIVSYIEEKQIPWCHVYGNHDREGGMSNEAQQPIFESYEYCISKTGPDITGVGNYVHGIYNKDGTLGSVIYFLDSGTSNSSYTYDYLAPDQIAWYKQTSELLQEYNEGQLVYGMMAFHIPLIENRDAYNNKDNNAIVTEYTGNRNENICSTEYKDDQMFETILERGDVKAIVTGHDHVNDYMYNYYGVKLCSSPNISDMTYYNANVQGSRVFDLNLNTITDIPTYVSYIIERINPDLYGKLDENIVIESFDEDGTSFGTTGYDNAGLSGSVTVEITQDGKLQVSRSSSGNFEVDMSFTKDKYGKLGDNKYLIVWVDFTNVDFRKACFGLLSTDGTTPYRTDDHDSNSPFYYLADGTDEWETLYHGGDGCFGEAQGTNMLGKKGYLALPTEYFKKGAVAMNEETLVTGIYMYADVLSGCTNTPFYLDNFALVEDYLTYEFN